MLYPITGAMWEFPLDAYFIPLTPKKGYLNNNNINNNNNNTNINNNNNVINITIDKSKLQ